MTAVCTAKKRQAAMALLVGDALYEITLLARAAQRYIQAMDSCGEVAPVTRGMMLRIQVLSEAVSAARDPKEAVDYVDKMVNGLASQR